MNQELRVIAYTYTDPTIEQPPELEIWGWEIDREYRDVGGRSELAKLLADCGDGGGYLLLRSVAELGDSIASVRQILAKLAALNLQLITTETQSKPQLNMLALIEAIQTELLSRRMRQGHAKNRLNFLPPPGKAPYGYRRTKDKYTIDRAAATAVKDFFDRFILYGSIRGAVRYLAEKYHKKIAPSTGLKWLSNPVYRGDTQYLNGEVIADTHAAILSREEAAQIDRLLRRNRRLPPRTASAPRSLAGLTTCTQCGQTLTVTTVTSPHRNEKYLYLRPNDCPRQPKCKSIAYDRVLQATIERICVDLPAAVARSHPPDLGVFKDQIGSEIAEKQQTIARLPELIKSGVLDRETVDLRVYKLKTEISSLQTKLAALPPVNLRSLAQAVSIPQFWLDLSESERRFYFREFIRTIEIDPQATDLGLQLKFIF